LRALLDKPDQLVIVPGTMGFVRSSGAIFVDEASHKGRNLMIGEALELIGYGNDQKTFRARHATYGVGMISVSDVAVQ
jgi:hypothetical protein